MSFARSAPVAIALASLVSACGAGGTGGGARPAAPVLDGPASLETPDLVAFAEAGSAESRHYRDNVGGAWEHVENCGTSACVSVARLVGAEGVGLAIHDGGARGGRDALYRVFGTADPDADLPSGVYNGHLTATYRVGADGAWVTRRGDVNMALDMREGTVAIGGILPYDHPDGPNSIQIFGDADVVGGRFEDADMKIVVGSGAPDAFETTGRIKGVLVSGSRTNGVLGTIESRGDRDRFAMKGGYIATHNRRFRSR
jgi:hypothetical protein